MLNQSKFWMPLMVLGLVFGTGSVATAVEMEMEAEITPRFRKVEQPLPVKAAVTVGGIGLIGLELWWFLWSKNKSQKATSDRGIQEITINVDGGYEPDRITVEAGKPVRLNFYRKDSSSCLAKVLLPDFHIAKDLPMNQITPIEFTPEEPGEYPFTCGMNMYRGAIAVQESGDREMVNAATS